MEPNIFSSYREWLEHEKMPKGKKAALVAAMELFSETGFDGTSTVQVAERAGISQATIFKYFHTKQDLMLAIVKPVMEHLFPAYRDEFFHGISERKTLPEMVAFIVTDRYQFIKNNEQAVKILAMEMMTNEEMRQLFGKLAITNNFNFPGELLNDFRRTGQLRDDIDVAGLMRILAGQLVMYVIQSTFVPDLVQGEQADLKLITAQIVRTISK
ncbi:TetR/AcrR family transcriptional regulator [Levilactobacillus enshiensis]|uniref:TetR/AcrR family transcriptional regulator n=1 Tax=Levilactobacillus enshiensis TaxID=2590213 RepID=UPI001CDB6CC6|nr:TetR/AcrR family transcriptional regulator [Levilactobacillus enshiensis]